MTEGRLYICRWTERRGIYRLWVKGKPDISAEASSFEAADERLNEAIVLATGDGENRRQYVPAMPGTPLEMDDGPLVARLRRVVPVTRVEILNEAELFDGGLCAKCGMPLGARTKAPIVVDRLPTAKDGMRLESQRRFGGLRNVQGYSDRFIDALTAAERGRLEWRPIESRSKQKRQFVELLGGRVHAPFVALAGVGVSLNECSVCGSRRPPFYSVEPPVPTQYVVRTALTRRIPSLLTVGTLAEPQLCTTLARWGKLVEGDSAREISSVDVGVVEPESVDEDPVYERY